jgi:hypothetical protein
LSFEPAAAASNARRFRTELFYQRMRAQLDALLGG